MDSFLTTRKGRQLTNLLVVFLAVLSLFFLFKFINEVKQGSYIGREAGSQNTINVAGEGEVFAVPDVATFSFTVSDKQADASEAQRVVTNSMNKILEALEDQDIDEKDVKTTSYNIYPRYEYKQIQCFSYPCNPSERVLSGYEVSHRVLIKVRDTEDTGTLLALVGEMGADNVSGINFSIDDEEELKEEARALAITDAQEKAERLAKDLGVKLVRIVSFYESNGGNYYARAESASFDLAYGGDDIAPKPSIPTGENKISSSVNITYEIK